MSARAPDTMDDAVSTVAHILAGLSFIGFLLFFIPVADDIRWAAFPLTLFTPLLWLPVAIVAIVRLPRHGIWVLLGAPFAFAGWIGMVGFVLLAAARGDTL